MSDFKKIPKPGQANKKQDVRRSASLPSTNKNSVKRPQQNGVGKPPQRATSQKNYDNSRSSSASKRAVRPKQTGFQAVYSSVMSWFYDKFILLKNTSRNVKLIIMLAVVAVALSLTVFLSFKYMTRINANEVCLDNNPVGTFLINKKKLITPEELTELVVKKIESDLGSEIKLNATISLKEIHASDAEVTTQDHVIEVICATADYNVKACSIKVDSVEKAIVTNDSIANEILDSIKNEYKQENLQITEIDFVEKVALDDIFVKSDQIIDKDKAHMILTALSQSEKTWEIKSGDTLYGISAEVGMSVDEILALNPSYTIKTPLTIGNTLLIMVPKPLLSVITKEKIVYERVVPKEVEIQYSNEHSKSYQKIITQGRDGREEVTEFIVRVNGFEQSREFISSKEIEKQITEVKVVGTK